MGGRCARDHRNNFLCCVQIPFQIFHDITLLPAATTDRAPLQWMHWFVCSVLLWWRKNHRRIRLLACLLSSSHFLLRGATVFHSIWSAAFSRSLLCAHWKTGKPKRKWSDPEKKDGNGGKTMCAQQSKSGGGINDGWMMMEKQMHNNNICVSHREVT